MVALSVLVTIRNGCSSRGGVCMQVDEEQAG